MDNWKKTIMKEYSHNPSNKATPTKVHLSHKTTISNALRVKYYCIVPM